MAIKTNDNSYKIILNLANPSDVITLDKCAVYREIQITNSSVFNGASVFIQRKLSNDIDCDFSYQKKSLDDWNNIISFTTAGSGISLVDISQNGQLKFTLIDANGNNTAGIDTNIIIFISF